MKWKRALLTAYTLFAVGASGALLLGSLTDRVMPAMQEWNGDGDVDWWGAIAYRENWNPYSPEGLKRAGIPAAGFGHPPTTVFWFQPFSQMDPRQMHLTAGMIVVLMLAMQLFLVGSELGDPAPFASALLVLSATLYTSWMRDHLAMVQIGVPIGFFLVLGWYFLRHDDEIAGGAMIGLACTFKFFPGLLVVFLLLTRRWRGVIAAGVVWLAIAAVMTSRFGLVAWRQFFESQKPTANFWMANLRNASLQGIVARLFHPTCKIQGGIETSSTVIASLAGLALLILAWLIVRRGWRRANSIDGPYALFFVLAVFLNPWIWDHYDALLLFPLAVALSLLYRGWYARVWRPALAIGVVVWTGIVWLLSLDLLNGRRGADHFHLHLMEVANWLPWLLTIALLMTLTWALERRRIS